MLALKLVRSVAATPFALLRPRFSAHPHIAIASALLSGLRQYTIALNPQRLSDINGLLPPNFHQNYRVTGWLGAGAWSEVYEVMDNESKSKLALKLIPKDNLPGGSDSFEASYGPYLHHPHLISYGRCFETSSHLAVTMPVFGEPLASEIQSKGYPDRPTALGYLVQVADALCYLHQKGVSHGDVSISNINVDGANAVLLDLMESSPFRSSSGGVLDGCADELSHDILCLGRIAAELLVVRSELHGDRSEIRAAVQGCRDAVKEHAELVLYLCSEPAPSASQALARLKALAA
ncbi:kinase-like domain-containing protein [Polychytrium aggregatum]|uniref:kinase-like domain-containing protein n=1 Tax=Polychytrium aggregatum TaxID=110093 RepID=UPI0022FF23E6|nr:kinase-like domain-containing protein [Polychytrium aggregatum]KAI9203659.1 kinase-like domain-containing protein [Polychytrium aggregatum]